MLRRFNFGPFTYTTPAELASYVLRQFKLLAGAVPGAVLLELGNSGATMTVTPPIADQTKITLTANCTLTLSMTDMHASQSGDIEFTQDGTGGWVVTFVNLVGTVPPITATAGKRTLVGFTNVGDDGWVATVKMSNY